jgi:hypothetical protein
MTTVQESPNGHRISPLPCPFPDSQEENRSKDSTNNNSQFAQHGSCVVERQKDVPSRESHGDQELSRVKEVERQKGLAANAYPQDELRGGKDITSLLAHEKVTGTFPANAYHVPPARFAPKAYPYRHDDTLNLPPETDPLPERCQFMFSDGRQCTMARSDIHPSLCHYHSEREEQLFGTPSPGGGSVVGAGFDLPELFSACRDLTTAAGVNRALGQVFRLLAQRRISRQEAATFAKLGHLLLQSISAVHSERVASVPRADLAAPRPPVPTLAAAPTAQQEGPLPRGADNCGIPSAPEPSALVNSCEEPDDAVSPSERSTTEPPRSLASINQPFPTENPAAHNQRRISTYENTEVKAVHNEHLRKKRRAV